MDGPSGPLAVGSPDGRLRLTFRLDEQARPAFDVAYRDAPVAADRPGLRRTPLNASGLPLLSTSGLTETCSGTAQTGLSPSGGNGPLRSGPALTQLGASRYPSAIRVSA